VALPDAPACQVAVAVVRALRQAGHAAYLVGGCVRDLLLGLEAKDYDVATSAHPPEVKALFRHVVEVGVAFGVLQVRQRLGDEWHEVEVATFRAESGYLDKRRPSDVRFTDAREDVLRRDFTINGLLIDPLDDALDPAPRGLVVDFVGGVQDLQQGLLRAIGVPQERFGEDALRLLRAARFAARFDLRIAPATTDAVRALAGTLAHVSLERVAQELGWMLTAPTAPIALAHVADLGLSAVLWPDLHAQDPGLQAAIARFVALHGQPSPSAAADAFQPAGMDLPLAIAALLWPVRDRSKGVARHWRLSREDGDALYDTWRLAERVVQLAETGVELEVPAGTDADVEAVRTLRHDHADRALRVLLSDPGLTLETAARLAGWRELRARTPTATWKPPPFVDGNRLLALGHVPGPRFKGALEAAERAQLRGVDEAGCVAVAVRLLVG
jgi:poly(A) polymerase